MELKGKHSYQVSGNQILVPVDQAYSIRGELASEQRTLAPTSSLALIPYRDFAKPP